LRTHGRAGDWVENSLGAFLSLRLESFFIQQRAKN
jgi:hypothetical protein